MNHKYVSLLQLILAQDTYDNAWRKKKYTKPNNYKDQNENC